MLTAKQALEIATSPLAAECVSTLLGLIEKAAQEKKTTLRTYLCDFGSGRLYGGSPTLKQQEIMSSLRSLGYFVEVRAEEKQFVDVYLFISWENAK